MNAASAPLVRTVPGTPPPLVVRWSARLARFLRNLSLRLGPPQFGLLERVVQGWVPEALGALVRTGLAEALSEGPRQTASLARELDLDPGATHRLLRALAREGLLVEDGDRFGLNAVTAPLCRDHPHSLHHMTLFATAAHRRRLWGHLPQAVRTGEPMWTEVLGEEPWAWYAAHPEAAAHFHGAMAELTREGAPALARAYDFGKHGEIVDLGGGTGTLLAVLLAAHPGLRGVLVDWPQVVAEAPATFAAWGVADRAETVGGDVLAEIPAGRPAYLAKKVLHGLGPGPAGAALDTWRAAMRPGTPLLLVELVVPEEDAPFLGFLDLEMLLASAGGLERTRAQWAALLEAHGFRLVAVHETASPDAVIEAVAVGAGQG